MSTIASQITSLAIVYSTVYSGTDQRKHQSSASLAFVWGIHRWSVNSTHKEPVTRKMFPFDDVIMENRVLSWCQLSRYYGYSRLSSGQPAESSVTPKLASLRFAALNVTHPYLTSMLVELISVGKRDHSSHAEWRYAVLTLITRNTPWYVQEWLTYCLVSSEIYLPCREEPLIAFWCIFIHGGQITKQQNE